MAKEIWITTSEFGHGPLYTVSFRTPHVKMAVDKLVMNELVVPVPGIKKNIDECKDTEKVTVQSLGYLSKDELELLYWEIQQIIS